MKPVVRCCSARLGKSIQQIDICGDDGMKQLLRDLAEIGAGQGAPQGDSNYCDDGTPFVKAGNLESLTTGAPLGSIQKVSDSVAKEHRLKLYPKGTVLFAKSGMSCLKGYVYVLPKDAYVVSHLACVTPKEDLSEYLRYYFLYRNPNQLVKDASYPSISLADIGDLEIDTKDKQTRKHIIATLSLVERVIQLRQKQLSALDDLIKARFVEMFGDPHRSKTYPYIKVSELTDVVSGGTPDRKNADYWNYGTIPWIKTTELQNNVITEVEERITDKGLSKSSAKIVPASTILIAMYGQGKTRGMTGFLGLEACTNQACACLLPTDKINMQYLWRFLILSYDELRGLAQGGNQPNLNAGMIKGFPILVPPMHEQQQFVSFVKQIDKSKSVIQKSLDETQLLFDSLMQKYFG